MALAASLVLLIMCGIEFNNLSLYVEAQCFVLSSGVSSNDGISNNGKVLYWATWNITLYDSDGTDKTTGMRSSTSESAPALDIYDLVTRHKVSFYREVQTKVDSNKSFIEFFFHN
jgi:hypothetical protein